MMNFNGMPPMGGKPQGGPPPGFVPPMADISWVKRKYLDVAYAEESKAQILDIYLPDKGEGPFPVLIHIHGGGFALGDKRDDHMDAYLKALHRGMAAVSIEYRLSGEAAFPAAVLDVRAAIRFLKEHAEEYKLDADKFVVIGGSAGGNLAAMLAMNVENGAFTGEEGKVFRAQPFVALGIDQFGPMNFKTMDAQARANGISHADHDEPFSPESKYLGVAIPDAPDELIAKANPATYAGNNMADMLVQHGTADVLVPYEQSVEFVEALRAKVGEERITFIPIEGANHEDKKFFAEDNMKLVFDYIDRKLGI
ncbi:MAG: alpha/beta fold hydrolase [Lachnospiraceae bacterium]